MKVSEETKKAMNSPLKSKIVRKSLCKTISLRGYHIEGLEKLNLNFSTSIAPIYVQRYNFELNLNFFGKKNFSSKKERKRQFVLLIIKTKIWIFSFSERLKIDQIVSKNWIFLEIVSDKSLGASIQGQKVDFSAK